MPASQPFSWLTRRSFAESSTRYPTSPCSPGIRPVVKLAMAAAVVDGVTVRITSRRAIRVDRNRAWPARAWMFDAPRPSTSTTTAPDAAGSPKSFASPMRLATELPSTPASLGAVTAGTGSMAGIAPSLAQAGRGPVPPRAPHASTREHG